ncbi:MAG TPA: HAMP domain-containing sensor histidine kinase [Ktedonobacterales bacterium]|nr:HAMP domain-containing sensor histidine kinase [Ktedonobacterales bacterium]
MLSSLPPAASSPSSPPLPAASQPPRQAELSKKQFWLLAGVLLALVVGVAALLAVTPSDTQRVIGTSGRMLSMLFAALCCFWMSRRAAPGRERLAWDLIMLAVAGYVIAEGMLIFLLLTQQRAPSAGITAALSSPFYVLGATGVLLLPAVQTTGAKLIYVLLEVGITVGAMLGLGLVFGLARRLTSGVPVDYGIVVVPVVDVMATLAFIVLLIRGVQQHYRPVLLWLIGTAVCFTYGDIGINYLTLPRLPGSPASLPFFDPIWMMGAFAVALAPLSLLTRGGTSGPAQGWLERLTSRLSLPPRFQWAGQLLVLLTPAGVLFGLTIYSASKPLPHTILPLVILGLVVVVFIITRQVFTTRDLVDARIATERAEQLDGLKDQFITSVNHELRTPLMTMKSYLTLLTDPAVQAPAEKRQDMLTRANRSCENLVYLVQGILDTRRIDQEATNFTPEHINVLAATQAALTLIDPREADPASRQIAINVPNHLMVWGEQVRVQQILTNLITNAIKYSPAGTPVTMQARVVTERGHRLLADKSGARQVVEIAVQDRGLGIPPEQQALLFRRFVRLPRDIASTVRGTGLGLYLCRVFAEAMGGSIWIESSGIPGEGSTFFVRLPTQPDGIPAAPALAALEIRG